MYFALTHDPCDRCYVYLTIVLWWLIMLIVYVPGIYQLLVLLSLFPSSCVWLWEQAICQFKEFSMPFRRYGWETNSVIRENIGVAERSYTIHSKGWWKCSVVFSLKLFHKRKPAHVELPIFCIVKFSPAPRLGFEYAEGGIPSTHLYLLL